MINKLNLHIFKINLLKDPLIKKGKGQNVENHFVESQKKNIESLKVDWKCETDQNIKSQIRLLTFWTFLTPYVKSECQKSNLSDFQISTTYGISTYGVLASILNL